MDRTSGKRLLLAAAVIAITGAASAARAQDFFSALFGGMDGGRSQQSDVSMPYADDGFGNMHRERRPRSTSASAGGGGGRQAYCVRTCDGRYFPLSASDNSSRAASCNNFCPSSETKVVYGSSIDQAATDSGKPYSELPNAYKYRTELVAGCTCNGKDQTGLAPVKLENDPTLRKGDIVAGADGLMVTARTSDKRGASLEMSPASASVRAKYEAAPVVASE
ncbi:MAG: DUF2865 domain-containing protein [Pseudorhodoplanes sp.]